MGGKREKRGRERNTEGEACSESMGKKVGEREREGNGRRTTPQVLSEDVYEAREMTGEEALREMVKGMSRSLLGQQHHGQGQEENGQTDRSGAKGLRRTRDEQHNLHSAIRFTHSTFSSAHLTAVKLQGECYMVTGQTKSGSEAHHEKKNIKDRVCRLDWRYRGPHPGARPGVGARRRAPGGRVFAHGTRPGSARNGDVGPPSSRLTTRRKVHEGPVQCGLGSSRGRGASTTQSLEQNSGNRDMECHLTGGKEPELVREVERYCQLEIVGLTSTHSLGSGTQLLERGWTLHYSGVAQGERRRAGVGLLIAPQLSRHVLEFTPVNERVASLRLRVGLGIGLLLLFVPTGRTAVQSTRPSWSPWEGYLIVLRLGTPLFYWGTSTLTWATTVIPGEGVIGRNGLPDLNPSGVLLLDFCASHGLSITNTMFETAWQGCPSVHMAPGHP
ncbi:hypothetical protein L3Q82_004050 [Scortum barcoo]|uniref:Uncharacterized protein n=1 Tax=Scortum barcoo TaxID=214431 RepID=A0ACB8X6T3_9TELE|nr:hypothetical protein L3Q82_004050 [Scortum barcoo]